MLYRYIFLCNYNCHQIIGGYGYAVENCQNNLVQNSHLCNIASAGSETSVVLGINPGNQVSTTQSHASFPCSAGSGKELER